MALFSRGGFILRQNNEFMKSVAMIRWVSNWKLFVGGLGPDINSMLLREAFSAYGEVIEAKAVMDKKSVRCRGYGFVEFPTYRSASKALNTMDQWELFGRTVTVDWAKNSKHEYTWEDAVADGNGDLWDIRDDDSDYGGGDPAPVDGSDDKARRCGHSHPLGTKGGALWEGLHCSNRC